MVDVQSFGEGPRQSETVIAQLEQQIGKLPVWEARLSDRTPFDWLLTPEKSEAGIYRSPDGKSIVIANGMVARTFRIFPNLATTHLTNRMTGESMIRAVSGEGFLEIDGKKWTVGGLSGQHERAYLKEDWIEEMTTVPESFLVEDFEIRQVGETLPWARNRWALNKKTATGKELVFTLRGEKELKDVVVKVCFAIYDEIPVIRKRMEVENRSAVPLNIDAFKLEYLAFAEPESPGDGNPELLRRPSSHRASDYACKGSFKERETDTT